MDPRPRAYDPAPTCSFRSGPSPPPNVMQKQGAPSVFRAQTRAERRAGGRRGPRPRPLQLAGARGGGPPGDEGGRASRGARGAQTRAAFSSRSSPTLPVTEGAQPMGEPERPGSQARDREGEPREGEGKGKAGCT